MKHLARGERFAVVRSDGVWIFKSASLGAATTEFEMRRKAQPDYGWELIVILRSTRDERQAS